MKEQILKPSNALSRRQFCTGTIATALSIHLAASASGAATRSNKVKFYKNLGNGHIGLKANQQQAVDYAAQYGFDAISPNLGAFANKSKAEIRAWLQAMKAKGIRYGTSGLPVEFRKDEASFQRDLKKLPQQAAILKQLGVTRVATWVLPGHKELTYLQNFKRHRDRLGSAAKILKDHGLRLGLEFVGPRTSRARNRYPFICTQTGMMELVKAIDTGNVGLLMDSWHWYTSHGTVDELRSLSNHDIVHVHVNDAPAGIPVDQQVDNRRKLPTTTGVIDLKGFINALVAIGYNGPVECEPFDNELRKMADDKKLKSTINALNGLWDLIEA